MRQLTPTLTLVCLLGAGVFLHAGAAVANGGAGPIIPRPLPLDSSFEEQLSCAHCAHPSDQHAQAIKNHLDNVGAGFVDFAGRMLMLRYPTDQLIRACITYIRGGGFSVDGIETAAWVLARAAVERRGDQAILDLLASEQRDMIKAARDVLRGRLSGFANGALRMVDKDATKFYRELPRAQKITVVAALLETTGLNDRAAIAAIIERLGPIKDMREIALTRAYSLDAQAAANRVGLDRKTTLANACALALGL